MSVTDSPHVVIAGGGFAGVWAAIGAAATFEQHGAAGTITLVTRDSSLTIRPRLYERMPTGVQVPLAEVLAPLDARLELATIAGADPARGTLALDDGRELTYDALVVATGSRLARPAVPGLAEHAHDIDTMASAARLWERAGALLASDRDRVLAVVGGGLTGIELAAELASEAGAQARAGTRVLLLDAAPTLAESYAPAARAEILAALARLGVEHVAGRRIAALHADALALDDGTRIATDLVAWTAGLEATPLALEGAPARDPLGRLVVGDDLGIAGQPGVYAAGDAAAIPLGSDRRAPMSCQLAIPTGGLAGRNAAMHALGEPTAPFAYDGYVTCLDLGAAGAVFTFGWSRELACAGDEGKQRKQLINRTLILPPTEREQALQAGGGRPGAAAAIARATR